MEVLYQVQTGQASQDDLVALPIPPIIHAITSLGKYTVLELTFSVGLAKPRVFRDVGFNSHHVLVTRRLRIQSLPSFVK